MGLHPGEGGSSVLAGLSADEIARFDSLQERLSVRFRRLELLREAMTHASWNNERGEPGGPGHDNERLEYLGDAVLELVVGEYLFRRFPAYDEGQLTQLRAALVNTITLAKLAKGLELGETLLLGKGAARTGARELRSLLANSFEAMIGAVFLDQGYRVATRIFLQNIGDLADWTDENHKGRLQEVAQGRVGSTPSYKVVASVGPGHKREYTADAKVGGDVVGHGRGPTKQEAEQAAAQAAVAFLTGPGRPPATAGAGAAHAARHAAHGAAAEPARVRRRVAEAAGERSVVSRDQQGQEPPAEPPVAPPAGRGRRGGLIGKLRAAAEVLVGRAPEGAGVPDAGAHGAAVAAPTPGAATAAPGSRRRGRRGGRGRTARPAGAPPTPPDGGAAGRPVARRAPRERSE